jgi:large subunit ribosomal protein L30e
MVTKKTQQDANSDQQVLARVLKEALKSGKYTIGTKEVVSAMKSSKLVIAASTLQGNISGEGGLTKEAEKNNIPVVHVNKSSAQLGRMIGRPFRVSAIAIRAVAEGDFRLLVASSSTPVKPQTEE